jgi:DNA-binding Lrp family transcriptional regulator
VLDAEKQILTALQRGVEITSCPFQCLETVSACSPKHFQSLKKKSVPQSDCFQTLEVLKKAQADGLIRRFGGIFDSRRLGYKSILCALEVAPEELEEKAAIVSAHPGVTHCYERSLRDGTCGMYPSLWFTLAMPHDEFEKGWKNLCSKLETGNSKLFQLPALRRFKIDVVFDLTAPATSPSAVEGIIPDVTAPAFSAEEKDLVRAIDQQIPLVERPFAAVAEQLGQTEEWVLSTLRQWKEQGILRRIGAVLYHREAGLKNNAMCVWPVEPADQMRAGTCGASRPEVTHCYQRPRLDVFPFDLYAMIHTPSREQTEALFKNISESCGLSGGELFVSGREFKKSSMRYFR